MFKTSVKFSKKNMNDFLTTTEMDLRKILLLCIEFKCASHSIFIRFSNLTLLSNKLKSAFCVGTVPELYFKLLWLLTKNENI